jgi:hypothetical protein
MSIAGVNVQVAGHPAGCTCASCCRLQANDANSPSSSSSASSVARDTSQSTAAAAKSSPGTASFADRVNLSPEARAVVDDLKARDREVRAHEAAHQAAAAGLAGAASFSFETGPDGVQYAVGGEVPISTSTASSNPVAALRTAETVERAALAPAQPSGQDLAVAAAARAMAAQAQRDIVRDAISGQSASDAPASTPDETSKAAPPSPPPPAPAPRSVPPPQASSPVVDQSEIQANPVAAVGAPHPPSPSQAPPVAAPVVERTQVAAPAPATEARRGSEAKQPRAISWVTRVERAYASLQSPPLPSLFHHTA